MIVDQTNQISGDVTMCHSNTLCNWTNEKHLCFDIIENWTNYKHVCFDIADNWTNYRNACFRYES